MLATTIHNERIRLIANTLDRGSTVCAAIAIATPVAGFFHNAGNSGAAADLTALLAGLASWLAAAIALHCLARRVLARLR
ncbi:MAG: hypothetical protein ACRECY_12495 [Phyllobacterium sp.]